MFRNPFFFQGRITRTEYALSYVLYIACTVSILMILQTGGTEILALLLMAPMIWFMFAQGTKRCHDRNNSGFYQLIPFYTLWLLCGEGNAGDNDYGPDPRTLKEDLDLEEY